MRRIENMKKKYEVVFHYTKAPYKEKIITCFSKNKIKAVKNVLSYLKKTSTASYSVDFDSISIREL